MTVHNYLTKDETAVEWEMITPIIEQWKTIHDEEYEKHNEIMGYDYVDDFDYDENSEDRIVFVYISGETKILALSRDGREYWDIDMGLNDVRFRIAKWLNSRRD